MRTLCTHVVRSSAASIAAAGAVIALLPGTAWGGAVQGKVTVAEREASAEAEVTAKVYRRYPVSRGSSGGAAAAPWVVVTIDGAVENGEEKPTSSMVSKGLLLQPPHLVVAGGTEVTFKNEDYYPLSIEMTGGQRPPTLNKGESHQRVFSDPGSVVVRVREWSHMKAHILVHQSALFAEPDSGGSFTIANVESGVRTARVFIDGKEAGKTDVHVPAEGIAGLQVEVAEDGAVTLNTIKGDLVPMGDVNGEPVAEPPEPEPEPKPKPKAKPKRKPKPKPKPPAQESATETGGAGEKGGNGDEAEAPPPPPPPPAEETE